MNRTRRNLIALALTLSLVATGSAQTAPAGGPETQPVGRAVGRPAGGDGSGFDGWWKTIGAVVLVAGLIVGLRLLVRRLSPSAAGRSGVVRVIWQRNLTAKHHLFLLRIGRRVVLVGTGPGGVNLLLQTGDEQEVAELLGRSEPGAAQESPGQKQEKAS